MNLITDRFSSFLLLSSSFFFSSLLSSPFLSALSMFLFYTDMQLTRFEPWDRCRDGWRRSRMKETNPTQSTHIIWMRMTISIDHHRIGIFIYTLHQMPIDLIHSIMLARCVVRKACLSENWIEAIANQLEPVSEKLNEFLWNMNSSEERVRYMTHTPIQLQYRWENEWMNDNMSELFSLLTVIRRW